MASHVKLYPMNIEQYQVIMQMFVYCGSGNIKLLLDHMAQIVFVSSDDNASIIE